MLDITNHWQEYKVLNNKNSDKIVDGNESQLLENQFNGVHLKMFTLFNLEVLFIAHNTEMTACFTRTCTRIFIASLSVITPNLRCLIIEWLNKIKYL